MRVAFLCILVVIAALIGRVSAAEFSSLEERMSDAEFRAAGLDRLSAEELARLNSWLRSHSSSIPAAAPTVSEDRVGFRESETDRGTILSRIEGEFSGWSGKTVFKLKNGQWWQQTESGRFSIPSMVDPAVSIEPKVLGSWLLKVEGHNRSVRVTRIR